MLDRLGQGRTAPRDALISLSSDRASLGRSLGVHRAMDTAGALLGPLAAFVLLARLADPYESIFMISFAVSLIGLGILVLSSTTVGRARRRRASCGPVTWRLSVFDLASGRVIPLAERRNVDDQVEWLDASSVPRGRRRAAPTVRALPPSAEPREPAHGPPWPITRGSTAAATAEGADPVLDRDV